MKDEGGAATASVGDEAAPRSRKVRAKRAAKSASARKPRAKKAASDALKTRSVVGRTYDISKYTRVKTPAGSVSFDCGDDIAKKFRGAELADLYEAVAKRKDVSVRSLKEKYGKLNVGLQRMSLGNILRAASKAA
jgi:hypothetical protein